MFLKRLLVLTEVFFPFKDDIAVLTKFKLLQSEGIVLASVPPSFLLFVPSVAFFLFLKFQEPLGNQTSVCLRRSCHTQAIFIFLQWDLRVGFHLSSWLSASLASAFVVLVAVLGCGSLTPSYMTWTCIFLYCCLGTCLCVVQGANI